MVKKIVRLKAVFSLTN